MELTETLVLVEWLNQKNFKKTSRRNQRHTTDAKPLATTLWPNDVFDAARSPLPFPLPITAPILAALWAFVVRVRVAAVPTRALDW